MGNLTNASGVTAITSDPAQSGAPNYAFSKSAYAGWTFDTAPGGSGWFMIDGQTRPFGIWEYSTNITNTHQLQLMAMDLAASYTVARNIDLTADLAGNAGMWSSAGFVPLGDASTSFTGGFDGQGHTIAGLRIDSLGEAGLFGYSSGTIANIGLIGGSVNSANGDAGSLVGWQAGGSISQSYASGAVSSILLAGGLVGYQGGGSVSQSYASGAVDGFYRGGLVGNQVGGSIDTSYSTGQGSGVGLVSQTGVTAVTSDPGQSAAANYAYKQSAYTGFDWTVWAPPSAAGGG